MALKNGAANGMLISLAAPFLFMRKELKMTNNNRIDAIYARQSVDKKDSISIESQIEFCQYELKGCTAKELVTLINPVLVEASRWVGKLHTAIA